MSLYETFNFDTAFGTLSLSCIDFAEPNNGRMLYKVKLQLGEEDITETYFGNWNYINFNLDNYEPTSKDKKWIYIPKEDDHFLINSHTLGKTELPHLLLSAATFQSDIFIDDFILIASTHEIISKNLKTGSVCVLKQPDTSTYFKKTSLIGQNKILLELSDKTESTVSLETLTPSY